MARSSTWKGVRASVRVMDALDEQAPFDLVVVTLLAHQVDAVPPALQRGAARCIQFMFNAFDPEHLRDAVGPGRSAFGMSFVQALLDGDGRLKATIGAGGQKTLMDQERWADLFNAAGCRPRSSGTCAHGCAATPRCASPSRAYPWPPCGAAVARRGRRRSPRRAASTRASG